LVIRRANESGAAALFGRTLEHDRTGQRDGKRATGDEAIGGIELVITEIFVRNEHEAHRQPITWKGGRHDEYALATLRENPGELRADISARIIRGCVVVPDALIKQRHAIGFIQQAASLIFTRDLSPLPQLPVLSRIVGSCV